MNLVETLKKIEQGPRGVFFLPNPLRRRPHANHVHLNVQITSTRSAEWGGGTICPPPQKAPLADFCSIFFKVTTKNEQNFERLYTWSL